MYKQCIWKRFSNSVEKLYQSSKKKIASENARTSKIFFLPLSNCVNTEIHA